MATNKVKRILLEYEDGMLQEAVGDDANTIWEYYEGAVVRELIRKGVQYTGPQFKTTYPTQKCEACLGTGRTLYDETLPSGAKTGFKFDYEEDAPPCSVCKGKEVIPKKEPTGLSGKLDPTLNIPIEYTDPKEYE